MDKIITPQGKCPVMHGGNTSTGMATMDSGLKH